MVCLDFRRVAPVTVISGPASSSLFLRHVHRLCINMCEDVCMGTCIGV